LIAEKPRQARLFSLLCNKKSPRRISGAGFFTLGLQACRDRLAISA
jgi:hypothetical protein